MRRVTLVLLGTLGFSGTAIGETLDSQIQALESKIQLRAPDLQRERDRNGRLKKELMGTVGGCWAEQRINKLEILINGAHLPNGNEVRTEDRAMQNEGNAGQMKFTFSESLQYTITNEEQLQVFAPNGRAVSSDFSVNLVRDITMLKIVKGGIAWASTPVTRNCGFLGTSTCTDYANFETNRYSVGDLTIKVNDQVLYKRSGIGFTFEGNQREWIENNLTVNEAYVKLMEREDCPATN